MRRLLSLAAVSVLGVALPAPAGERPSVHLPTEADAVAVALGAETIFFGPEGVETVLPGPVDDRERVVVGLAPDGAVRRVEVTQRLTLSGLGDFRFKVPGPARNVEALPDSGVAPGLRRGSVLWQGFSEGEEVLAARVPLFPDQEAERLPVAFDLAVTVGGESLAEDEERSGTIEIDLEMRNTSAIPLGIQSAAVAPGRLAPILDRVWAALREGRRPRPGLGGVPGRIRAEAAPETQVQPVEAPFRLEGTLSFPPGTVRAVTVEGGEVEGDAVTFGVTLGGGRPLAHRVRVTGEGEGVGLPDLVVSGEPALPSAETLTPPGAPSWRAAVRSGGASGGAMLDGLLQVLWRVARLRQFDGYLGNPDPDGPAKTRYRFELLPPEPAAAPGPAQAPAPAPWTAAVTWGGIVFLLALAVVAWSLS